MVKKQVQSPKLSKIKKKQHRLTKTAFLTMNEVRDQLFDQNWRNDTLSPLTARQFWKLTRNLIPREEKVISALFATNSAYSLVQRLYVVIVTDQQIYQRSSATDNIINNQIKVYSYDKIKGIRLWQDTFLDSRIYVDLYLSGWKYRIWKLETADPTSTIHFKETIKRLRTNHEFEVDSNPQHQIDFKQLNQELQLESQKLPKRKKFTWFKRRQNSYCDV